MTLQMLAGLGPGYFAAYARKKEDEVKQGSNLYLASAYQAQNLGAFTSLAARLFAQIPYAPIRIGATLTNGALPFAGIVLCPTFAAVKQGHYEQGVTAIEPHYPRVAGLLPKKLDETRVKWISSISENMGGLTTKAILVLTATLPFFGYGYLAAGMAVPLTLEAISAANLMPTKLGLIIEKYMPTAANASLLLGGGFFAQAFAAVTLASNVPTLNDFMLKKVEKIYLKCLPTNGCSLDEVDAPWLERQDLSYEEIQYILKNPSQHLYEINPAHCSKNAAITPNTPVNRDFKSFLLLFHEVDWRQRYSLLKTAFKDDDRFIDLLMEKNPGMSAKEIRDDFEGHLEGLAAEKRMSKVDFLSDQLSQQMDQLVKILCDEIIPKGYLEDLDDAKDACSQVLAYLLSGNPSQVEKEDIFIKLAIEGGDYCARGIKRAAMELVMGIVSSEIANGEDPQKAYASTIRHHLQLMRHQILQNSYQKMIELMVRFAKEGSLTYFSFRDETTDPSSVAVAQDVHTMDLYRMNLTLGFYPMTDRERRRFGLSDLSNWTMSAALRMHMYQTYQSQLDEAIKQAGEVHFANYIQQSINDLPTLTESQKEELIDELSLCNDGEETLQGFHRLFFVMQGVLKVKSIYADWCEITTDSDEEEELSLDEWTLLED